MSFNMPSKVSATTGRAQVRPGLRAASQATTASRTTPTLCVLVIMIGPDRNPDSSIHAVPVISPLPLSTAQPAKTGSCDSFPRGRMAVTPVRTGPLPTHEPAVAFY